MDLESWLVRVDPIRRRRLLAGGALGAVGMSAGVVLMLQTAASVVLRAEEEPAFVSLEEQLPEQARNEPEPELDTELEPVPDEAAQAAGPRLAALRAPVEIPKDAPREVDVNAGDGEGGSYDPYAATGGRARAAVVEAAEPTAPAPAVAKVEPKPAAPARAPRAVTLTEGMTPPTPLTQPMPSYPAELKARGVEGVVVVRYKIDEQGNVAGGKVVSGPATFGPAIATVMRQWRFNPARDHEGKAVAVTRTHTFRFSLDTG